MDGVTIRKKNGNTWSVNLYTSKPDKFWSSKFPRSTKRVIILTRGVYCVKGRGKKCSKTHSYSCFAWQNKENKEFEPWRRRVRLLFFGYIIIMPSRNRIMAKRILILSLTLQSKKFQTSCHGFQNVHSFSLITFWICEHKRWKKPPIIGTIKRD